jgi:hypothetical protein
MATYGTRDATRFQVKGVQYYTLIESEGSNKGEITIKSPTVIGNVGGANLDRTVGVIPLDNAFKPELGSATTSEAQYFSSATGQKAVKNHAVITAQKAGAQNAQQLIFPNSARSGGTPTPQAPQQGGANGPAPTALSLPGPGQDGTGQTGELAITDPASISGVPTGSYVKYPKDMKDDQDKIKFIACEINPRTGGGGSGLQFSFGERSYTPVAGPVFLAIQSPISDQNSVDWGPDTVNAIDAALYNASLGAIKSPLDQIPTKAREGVDNILNQMKANEGRIQRFLAGQAAGLNNVLARTDNVVLNPNLELLFQGPQLRPFSFTFKMSARSQDEAKEIKSIIKYFKYHMAVRKERGLFLRAPYVFTIQYCKGNTPRHSGLNLISPDNDKKACALTNCSVDYTPLGTYATYEDGTMVAYTLSLQFQELEPVYDTDYKTYPHEIGF